MNVILKDAFFVGVSHIISAVSIIGIQIVLARILEPAVFGIFLLAQVFINLVEATIVVRSGEVALYWIGRSWKSGDEICIASGYAKFLRRREIVWNVATYGAIVLLAWPLQMFMNFEPILIVILGLTIPVQSGYGVAKSIFISSGRIKLQALFEVAYSATLFGLTALLVPHYGVTGAVWTFVIVAAAKTAIAYSITNKLWPEHDPKNRPLRPPSRGLSGHSIARNAAKNLAAQGDVLVLGIAALPEAIAVYKVARTLANLPTRVAGPVWSVLRPKLLSAIREKDYTRIRRLLLVPGLCFVFIGVVIIVPVWLGAESFIGWSYGEAYIGAGKLLTILLIGTWIFGAVTGWLNFALVVSANKRLGSVMMVILAISVVSTSYLAKGNTLGVAGGVSASLVVISVAAWILAFGTRQLMK